MDGVQRELSVLCLELKKYNVNRGSRPSPKCNSPSPDGFYFYHGRFGRCARKCRSPCRWAARVSKTNADGSKITMFRQQLSMNLGSPPIIDAGFIRHVGLLIDIRNQSVINSSTGESSEGWWMVCKTPIVDTVFEQTPYHKVLRQFPHVIRCAII